MKRLHEKARGRVLRSDDGETLAKMHDPAVIDEKDWKTFSRQVKVATTKIAGTDERKRPLWYEVTV